MLNRVILQGRLTGIPELRHTSKGTAVTDFSIAVEDSYSSADEKKVDFFDIKAWRGTAEFVCKYFDKGQQILIEGRLDSKKYTDKNDVKRKDFYVVADRIYFCGSKSAESQEKEFGKYFEESIPDEIE